jgi:hypothetical protein
VFRTRRVNRRERKEKAMWLCSLFFSSSLIVRGDLRFMMKCVFISGLFLLSISSTKCSPQLASMVSDDILMPASYKLDACALQDRASRIIGWCTALWA